MDSIILKTIILSLLFINGIDFNRADRMKDLRFDQQTTFEDIQCQDGSFCSNQSTCCQLSSGQYACCPLENAVCCSDHVHCCPENHQCEPEHGRCKKTSHFLKEIQCPDGSSCPDGDTCCPLESGDYGCCPLCDAVCCSDHLHCCPHGSTCDVQKSQCLTNISIPWLEKRPSFRHQYQNLTTIEVKDDFILCPDAISFCRSTSTCSSIDQSNWFCCPVKEAIICSDGNHCCPKDYLCDLNSLTCNHSSSLKSIELIGKEETFVFVESSTIKTKDKSILSSSFLTILCPDGISTCLEDTTCCQLSDGSYGCCPYPQATCCSDQIHCCPNGYGCDNTGQRCTRHLFQMNKTETIRSKTKTKSFIDLVQGKDEQLCPDGLTSCPIKSTCCANQNGQTYSCCPYSKGVCCGNNGSVCCPNGYVCDPKALSCQLENNHIQGRNRRSYSSSNEDYYQCGTSDVACNSDQTCCRTFGSSEDEYACCAFTNGQCCNDGRHCCPSDSICDVQSGGCIQIK